MSKIAALALNTFREATRNKVIYSVFAFAVGLVGCALFFGEVSIGDRNQVVMDFGLFGMSICGAAVTILIGVSLLNKELKQKTIYNILSRPITRSQFVIGKHLGLTATVILVLTGMSIALFIFLLILGSPVGPRFALSLYFLALEMAVLAAIVLFFSSMVITTVLPGILALAAYLAGHSIDSLISFSRTFGKGSPVLQGLVDVLWWVIPDLSIFVLNEELVYDLPISGAYVLYATTYSLCYSIVALGLAVLIFEYKEFE